MSAAFEAFMVFYLIECVVLVSAAAYYLYEPRVKEKKIYDPWGFWRGEK